MSKRRIIGAVTAVVTIGLLMGLTPETVTAYDSAQYKQINSSLACQCGCGLLVSVCTMDGCMCEGVRQQVGTLLDQGKSAKEVKQALVNIYGEQILAAPPKSGFNLSAYILPFVFLVLGGSIVYAIATRWIAAGEDDQRLRKAAREQSQDDSDVKHQQQIEQELRDLDL